MSTGASAAGALVGDVVDVSASREQGVVDRVTIERGFGFIRRCGAQHAWGRPAFFHRGSFRAAQSGWVAFPPVGTKVTFILVERDGRLRAEDIELVDASASMTSDTREGSA